MQSPVLLPHELHLHILSLLSSNDQVLSARLTCKEAAQRFGQPHHRIVCVRQPLSGYVPVCAWCLEGAEAALRQLAFHRKLLLLSRAAASGSATNVEFAWRLLQPHVFPELLHTNHYRDLLPGYEAADKERPHLCSQH